MRLPLAFLVLLAAGLLSGCLNNTSEPPLVLKRVGPPSAPSDNNAQGSLLVFSAITVGMPDNTLAGRRVHHSDYRILSEDGHFLQSVHNDYDNSWEGPREVELPAGKYRIVAQAVGYGTVTVPVLIAAHQMTRVHLERGSSLTNKVIHDNPSDCLTAKSSVGEPAKK